MKTQAYLLVSMAVLAVTIVVTQQQQQCMTTLDLVFVVDGSNSMGDANFQRQKTSLVNLVRTLNVGDKDIHVGLVLFSAAVNAVINLTGDKNAFIAAVSALQYPDESTRTDLGIEAARAMLRQYGRTESVPDVIMVITDGASTEPVMTLTASTAAKAQGITIYGIGVSGLIDLEELNKIASARDKVFITDNFNALESSLNNATRRACVDQPVVDRDVTVVVSTTPVPPVTAPPSEPACFLGETDVWFVVDVSRTSENLSRGQSMGDFENLKRGLGKAIEGIQQPSVANPGVRLGVVTFSETSRIASDISQMNSVSSAANAVQQIPGGVAQGGASLATALKNIATPPVNSSYRSYVAIVAPESTYGTNTSALRVELARLKALGYTIVIFAVKENGTLDQHALQMTASGAKYFYNVADYGKLEVAARNFTNDRLCNGRVSNSTGLCSNSGHREMGVGVVAHPTDCDKYIQCYYDESRDLDLAVVRHCPIGLHWGNENQTCASPSVAKCPYDKCKEECAPYKVEGSCSSFWDCKDGVSMLKCCPGNFTFAEGLGCQLDHGHLCADSCGTEKWCGKCQKKPNWEEPSGYDVTILGGYVWLPRPCFFKDFDIVHCGCTAPRDQVCADDGTFDFTDARTNGDINEGEKEGIRVSDVRMSAEGIILGHKSAVHVNTASKEGENQPFTLEFRFREDEAFSPYGETLFSSGLHCKTDHSLLVSATDQLIFAQVESEGGVVAEVKVPTKGLNQDEFKNLVLSYNDGVLSLSVSDETTQYIATTSAPHDICFSCGLDIGEGLNKQSFEGTVQKITVHSCAWPLLY